LRKLLASVLVGWLAWGTLAFGQSVDSSQIKLGVNKGLGGDAVNGLSVKIYRATSAPASPQAGNVWFDTSVSPATCKEYDGSAWQACQTLSAFVTQSGTATFPSSPTDGQQIWDTQRHVGWVYESSSTCWYRMDGTGTRACTGDVKENFNTGAGTITAPSGAITIASSATAGNMTAGTHVCAVQFANSTGGETTSGTSASSAVSITASKSIDYSVLPLGGTGTTQRRIYCSKATTSTPRYWVGTVNDNTSTTATLAGVADASMVIQETNRNYSGGLCTTQSATCAGLVVLNNTAQTTSGGCGSTGSSIICQISHSGTASLASVSTDLGVFASMPLASYNSGSYTIKYRVVLAEQYGGGSSFAANNLPLGGLYYDGTALASGPLATWWSGTSAAGPLSSSNVLNPRYITRTTAGAGSGATQTATINLFPKITAFPFWVEVVKRGSAHNVFISDSTGNYWSMMANSGAAANPTDANLSLGNQTPTTEYNQFVFPVARDGGSTSALIIEFDSLTLTQN
jgi:hypothetical protein